MKPPAQVEVKTLLDDLIPRGARRQMAEILEISEGDLSHRLNRYHERKLATAEGLREQWALAQADPKSFQALRAYIESLWDSWQLADKAPDAGEVAKESADYICAELQNLSLRIKRKELVESIATGKRRLAHLDSAPLKPLRIRKVG